MKNLPFFTTENGIASLTLQEIPTQGKAYIRLQAWENPSLLLLECRDFCRACGAEEIFATGHPAVEEYPFHTAIVQMVGDVSCLPPSQAQLFPVQDHTLETWLEIYRRKIVSVPNAASMTGRDGEEMVRKGEGYFVHQAGQLLGIGRVQGNEILFLASVQKGAGREVALALARAGQWEQVRLTVATANEKAMALYQSLGFLPTQEISRWYRIQ